MDKFRREKIFPAIYAFLFLIPVSGNAEQTTIAVASNFNGAMTKLVAQFERQSPHHVRVSYGSSGKIYAQIQHGAPFDAFFSADQEKPIKLEQNQRIVPDSRFTYASGALVLWSTRLESVNQQSLLDGKFEKIALANPKLAPYGLAATQVLDQLKLRKQTLAKWVQGENIAQTYQYVYSGNAELGFVAWSQVIEQKHAVYWKIPETLYDPIHQDAVILKRAAKNPATIDFINFLKSVEGRAIIESFGYRSSVQ
ncbi:MAG: molybdate ABC transporter substrate-binding protein [Pseudomonadales bacterium]|nr:molybdate ABC transporter substrate-binding protein [Pseudomonadales bacterium]